MKTIKLDKLVKLTEKRLGESRHSGTGFVNFARCPWKKHRGRFTFGVNPKTRTASCFACGRTSTMNRALGLDVDAVTHTGSVAPEWTLAQRETLPDGAPIPFAPLPPSWNALEALAEHAVEYLEYRGVSQEYASLRGVGYGIAGRWVGYVIFPWYDDDGKLGGWQGRVIGEPQEGEPKVRTTSPLRTLPNGKVVGDGAFVFKTTQGALGGLETVRRGSPVVLVEGPFDFLSVSRVLPAVWMQGGRLYPAQYKRLLKRGVSEIIYANDPDKYGEALKNVRSFYGKGDVKHSLLDWGDYEGDWAADEDGRPLTRSEVEGWLSTQRPYRPGM